ncbi:5'-nucleotidase C-terminal domain-containing protein [Acholeplasma hippikon]|uniref:Endonuclease YhcR n=1 Tax=Acholeplasma hippikon TaxID=264636 RepID=A0A449BJ47_9MOLU|nr:5'-nucleotidase C-terminal domain-containing protein [Acholeplasma hippikon]VEU82484.1 Endonuclease YhcR precursor [Acholeplasma hippikon]
MKKILTGFMIIISMVILVSCFKTEEEKETFKITYMVDYKTYLEQTIVAGKIALEPQSPSKDNYEFKGWYLDLDFSTKYDFVDPVTSDLYLFAKFIDSNPNKPENAEFTFYYINDLHGAVLADGSSMGLASIANVVLTDKTNKPDETLFLGGGDLLQGQIISNYYDGASVIDILNDMKLDAFVVGNHEFDWGFEEVIMPYFNGENELQANYPILGANIYDKNTYKLIDDMGEYTIINKQGLKIAVIGTIGYGLESSISFTRVEKYIFIDPVERTQKLAEHVRTNEGADIVIAVNHQDSSQYNEAVTRFTGNQTVDAVFNGHTHYNYVRYVNGKPVIQSGANGTYLGKLVLSYDQKNGVKVKEAINLNKYNEPRLNTEHPKVKEKVDFYHEEIEPLYEPILYSSKYYSRDEVAYFITDLMLEKTNADVAIHNFGGTRDDISQGEGMSYSKLFQISPFDNTVVTVKILGRNLNYVLSGNANTFKTGLNQNNIDPNKYYVVATNDYIYGGSSILKAGLDVKYTGLTILDMFVENVELQKEMGYLNWNMENRVTLTQLVSITFINKKESYLEF